MGIRVADEHWKQAVVAHVDRYSRALFVTANRIVNDPAEAEDICQSAYVKALAAEAQIKDRRKLHGWLTRVVTNRCLDVLRRRQVERAALREGLNGGAGRADVLRQLEDREYVAELLEQLDERTRCVVVMRVVQGLSGREVMEQMGCSVSLVSRILNDGLARMREIAHRDTQQEACR